MSTSILMVEDNKDISNMITKMLTKHAEFSKFSVTRVRFLKGAMKLLKSNKFDCILLDLMLPNGEGVQTFKDIKSICEETPIVIISGFDEDGCEAVRAGAQDFIPKIQLTPRILERSIKYSIERKNLELEKLKAQEEFNNIVYKSPLGVHLYELQDDDLYFCGYNPAADSILSLDHSKLVGLKIEDAFPTIGNIKHEYIKVIESGEPWTDKQVDYEDNKIDGSFSIFAFKIDDNKMATTFQDVTEKIRIQENLRKSEERFRLLSEASFEGIVVSKNGVILDCNKKFLEMTEYSMDEITGRRIESFAIERDRNFILDYVTKNSEEPYETKIFKKNGSVFPVEINPRALSDGLRLTAVRDMTRYKEAERKEEIIFNELENRIHKWKEEIVKQRSFQENNIKNISFQIQKMSNQEEI